MTNKDVLSLYRAYWDNYKKLCRCVGVVCTHLGTEWVALCRKRQITDICDIGEV